MWTTSVADLRTLLSDGPEDRYRYRHRCFGEVNGTNLRFKTFEYRRVTDFTTTEGVYINGILQPIAAVATNIASTGEFILVAPPVDGDVVEANFYIQWFNDSELQTFIRDAGLALLNTDDVTVLSGGLIPAALKYAASEAYLKMAQRWREYLSQGYRVEDAPNKEGTGPVDSFIKMADQYKTSALKQRDDYYERQGRNLQPLFGTVVGRVPTLP